MSFRVSFAIPNKNRYDECRAIYSGVFALTKLLLIGAGEAHLSVLRSLQLERLQDVDVTLISSSRYSEKDTQLDIVTLCETASVTFIEDTIISFDPLQKMLLSFSGEIHRFDIISFDMGMKISLFKQALVPVDPKGLMLVNDKLQNTEFSFIFGAGKCVSIVDGSENSDALLKQGKILCKNIRRYLSGKPLKGLNVGSRLTFMDHLRKLLKKQSNS